MRDAFISYERRFPVFAEMVAETLSQENFSYWRDTNDIRPAESWRDEIDDGLEQSTILAVIVTSSAVRPEIIREIQQAKTLNKPYVVLVMEKLDNVSPILAELELDAKQAIDFADLGLATGRAKFIDAIRRLTDEWLPIQSSIDDLAHFSSIIRMNAIKALGNTSDARVLPFLFSALEVETEEPLLREILTQISHFRLLSVIEKLIGFIEAADLTSRDRLIPYAYELLGKVGAGKDSIKQYLLDKAKISIVPVRPLIENFPEDQVKEAVISNLEQQFYDETDLSKRGVKKRLIASIGGNQAISALERMLQSEISNPRDQYIVRDIERDLKNLKQE